MKWAAVDLVTGIVMGYLPDLILNQDLKVTLGRYESGAVQLPIASAPDNWLRLTKPWASAIIALDDSAGPGALPVPMWGGIVQQRPRTTGSLLSVPLSTAECYLMRRFIRDDDLQYPAASWGVCQVGADLLARYVIDGAGGRPGLPLRVVLLDNGPGRDVEWADRDDKQVYSAFTDMGFEWTITWEWQSNPQRITPVATLGTRIGQPVTAGLAPKARFFFPGNLVDAELLEDYTDGKGANDIMASSTGIGEVRPQSAHQVAVNMDGRPTIEDRYATDTETAKLADLNADAASELAVQRDGSVAITLTALIGGKAPRYGDRWSIGDDVGYDLKGPQFPDNPTGVVRAIGLRFNTKTFSPTLIGGD
ncbi:MAG: hypothetical protein ABI047_03165 [Jatrophihabitantaceae bacterium]